jgi:DNA invertase Pin-like site-specific DNA recombinase
MHPLIKGVQILSAESKENQHVKMMIAMLCVVGEMERDEIRERQRERG